MGFLEPDKVGELGCAYLQFYEFTLEKKYLQAALHCADALAAHVRPGDLSLIHIFDGEEEPSLRGTGTEDYFCDGWGFSEQSGPFYGTPLWEGYDTGDRGSAYRWHIPEDVYKRQVG